LNIEKNELWKKRELGSYKEKNMCFFVVIWKEG